MSINPTFEAHLSSLGVQYHVNARVCSPLLDGTAALVIKPDASQLPVLLPLLNEQQLPYQALGGSNTLLTGTESAPLETVVISTKRMRGVTVTPERLITAEAGAPIATVSKYAAAAALGGFEFAGDIPGTTAGAVATDAWHPIHAYAESFAHAGIDYTKLPKRIASIMLHAELVRPDGEKVIMTAQELEMANRTSMLMRDDNELFLAHAVFDLKAANPNEIALARAVVRNGRKAMRERNKAKNPYAVGRTLGYSFVLNHPDYGGRSAIDLISSSDCLPEVVSSEGMYHSKRTANIIGNIGRGTAEGYLRIADNIQQAVAKEHGIEMPLEVRIVK